MILSGSQVYKCVKDIDIVFGKTQKERHFKQHMKERVNFLLSPILEGV